MYLCLHLEMKKLFLEIERIFIIFRRKMDFKLNQVIYIYCFFVPKDNKILFTDFKFILRIFNIYLTFNVNYFIIQPELCIIRTDIISRI